MMTKQAAPVHNRRKLQAVEIRVRDTSDCGRSQAINRLFN